MNPNAPDIPDHGPIQPSADGRELAQVSAQDAVSGSSTEEMAPTEPVPQSSTDGAVAQLTVTGKSVRPLPESLTAARDALAFVTQLFAEVSAPEQAAAAEAAPQSVDEAMQDGVDANDPAVAASTDDEGASDLLGQRVLVLGLGTSGMAMVRWCVRQGAHVTVADTRETPPQLAQLQAELPQVEFRAGAFEASLVEGTEIRAVFKSPGLSPAEVAPVCQAAEAIGLWVGGELDLFARALSDLQAQRGYAPKVLAITGTNGKTTTTSLTGQLLSQSGKTVAVAGNIGLSLLDTLGAHIDAETLPEVWVLELSSFQLDGVRGFEPTAATLLNLTQDHLDWHGDMQAYGAAKARVFGSSGLLVLNRDDPAVMDMLTAAANVAGASDGQKNPTARGKQHKAKLRPHTSFGVDLPQRPGDYGIETVNGMAWLVRAAEADETIKRRKDDEEPLHIQRLMPVEALRIRGRHNATNALAALALAGTVGGTMAALLHGLREYTGEPHRVASVAVIRDVEYFDDSKGTNVGATVAALTGLGSERKLVLIAGGEGKGQDFAPLASPVQRHARAVVLIGRDANLIRAALEESGVALLEADSMQTAVEIAARHAQTGDAVLMSPACASFDMFDNYEHRAQVFCEAVHALEQDAGSIT
ncbi:MAG TPA: UDP-N-acetylmuramoyl-L-alanine--D-glutamate ligase [Polaromonas sp.]|uniref:UDP-N-acetylmuramoyl-L-alanine--D-glutamate ligase n=1 Tax=Polaromonas sp. TaxID=1869339 RepID=UPI002D2AE682|nr:UDP-N-acetylmuramoyl-L-alanine--D-glutamate ligase [Polaromonas sp.]HYW58232.1 UDP-N-acetylmuramoyl-L-alanine--D-glutamate ligase [Polaromonas sp.]